MGDVRCVLARWFSLRAWLCEKYVALGRISVKSCSGFVDLGGEGKVDSQALRLGLLIGQALEHSDHSVLVCGASTTQAAISVNVFRCVFILSVLFLCIYNIVSPALFGGCLKQFSSAKLALPRKRLRRKRASLYRRRLVMDYKRHTAPIRNKKPGCSTLPTS